MPVPGVTFEEFRPMLQDYYSPERAVLRAIYRMPTLRLLKKQTDWRGRDYVRPVWSETAQAVGHNFSDAQDQKGEGEYGAWTYTHKKIYAFASLDRLGLEASKGSARNFLSMYTAEVDSYMKLLAKELSTKIFRTEACVRSTVDLANSTLASGIIALANREDVIHFMVGQELVFSDAASAPGASLHTPGSNSPRFTVGSIDRSGGTITVKNGKAGAALNLTDAPATITTALANGDFIHRRGDVTAASNTLSLAGFESHVLSSADRASPGTFKGVDRTRDIDRLAGLNMSSAGRTIEDTLIEAMVRGDEAGVEFSHFCMHTRRFGQLIREVDSKLVRDDEKTSAMIGKRAIRVQLDQGEASIYADPYCQVNKIWGLNRDDIILKSTGALPGFMDNDVLMLRESNADAYEVRLGGYGEMTMSFPGSHIHIELT